jgi:hypothetical protein
LPAKDHDVYFGLEKRHSVFDTRHLVFFICSSRRWMSKLKNYNLIRERWIPVKRSNGDVEQIAPFEITSRHDTDPIVAFAWPRPDFDLASHEFLIGLLAAIYPADPREPSQWTRLFHTPPSLAELVTAFDPFADAFMLDGEGPRFLQDFDALDGEVLPIDELFIDAPGEHTDLFVKRAQLQCYREVAPPWRFTHSSSSHRKAVAGTIRRCVAEDHWLPCYFHPRKQKSTKPLRSPSEIIRFGKPCG